MKKLAGDIIISHKFIKNHNHMKYSSWDMEWGRESFLVILGYFLQFYPSNNRENENFKKKEKGFGDVIILHPCIKTHNHMMYASSDMKHDRHKFLSYWTIFCSFTPLLTPKIKILNKFKKTLRYYLIIHWYHKLRSYNVWFLRDKAQQTWIFVILGFFCPLTLLRTLKSYPTTSMS